MESSQHIGGSGLPSLSFFACIDEGARALTLPEAFAEDRSKVAACLHQLDEALVVSRALVEVLRSSC